MTRSGGTSRRPAASDAATSRPGGGPAAARPPLWRRVGLAVLAVLLGAAGLLGYRWYEQAGDRRDAVNLIQANRFADAVPVLDRALGRDPDDAELLRMMVVAKAKGGALLTEVASYLDRWCRLQPQNAEARKLRMGLRWQLHQTGPALEDGLRLLELTPDDGEVREQVAELLLLNGRLDEAEREGRRCLAVRPERRVPLLHLLAKIHQARNEPDRAAAVLDSLLRDQSDYPPAVLLRGVLYVEAEKFAEAVPLLRRAHDHAAAADRATTSYYLALALGRTGRAEEARKLLDEMQRYQDADRLLEDVPQQPDNLALKVRAAEALLKVDRRAEARSLLDQVLARDPNHADARRVLAALSP